MRHTQVTRTMREPTDAHRLQLAHMLHEHASYTWTGYPWDHLTMIWELRLYWIDDRHLTLVDTLLSEYYVEL